MFLDLIHSIFSNVWSVFLVVFFFLGSIFVHELGHFLAARRRGVIVERFSIGMGPAIWSRRGRDGVEYRLSWLPIGGYVLLPQLADLGAIEGETTSDVATLPPVSYSSKMLVFVAGAAFNLLFAFVLACIIWVAGMPESTEMATTEIGSVSRTLDLPNGDKVTSPAAQAGLRVGDVVRAIDGHRVSDWPGLMQALITSAGRAPDGTPESIFSVERDGALRDIILHPRLAGDEKFRRVGIAPRYDLVVLQVAPHSLAERAGFQVNDQLLRIDNVPIVHPAIYEDTLSAGADRVATATVLRGGREVSLTIPPHPADKIGANLGLAFTSATRITHPSPFTQVTDQIVMTFNTVKSLVNPHSDIGPSKLTGAVGIIRIFHSAAEAGILQVLSFTILLNVSLAILNLLPFPPLDGSQIAFATIARLRGRALPAPLIAATQSIFVMLFVSLFLYLLVFDTKRWIRDSANDAAAAAAANPAPKPPVPAAK